MGRGTAAALMVTPLREARRAFANACAPAARITRRAFVTAANAARRAREIIGAILGWGASKKAAVLAANAAPAARALLAVLVQAAVAASPTRKTRAATPCSAWLTNSLTRRFSFVDQLGVGGSAARQGAPADHGRTSISACNSGSVCDTCAAAGAAGVSAGFRARGAAAITGLIGGAATGAFFAATAEAAIGAIAGAATDGSTSAGVTVGPAVTTGAAAITGAVAATAGAAATSVGNSGAAVSGQSE